MFPSSVFFKLANVIDYDPFFSPIYSVLSENSFMVHTEVVKKNSRTFQGVKRYFQGLFFAAGTSLCRRFIL